jgi:hypothetical protein
MVVPSLSTNSHNLEEKIMPKTKSAPLNMSYPESARSLSFSGRYMLAKAINLKFRRAYDGLSNNSIPIPSRYVQKVVGERNAPAVMSELLDYNYLTITKNYSNCGKDNGDGTRTSGRCTEYDIPADKMNEPFLHERWSSDGSRVEDMSTGERLNGSAKRIMLKDIAERDRVVRESRKEYYRTTQGTVLSDLPKFGFAPGFVYENGKVYMDGEQIEFDSQGEENFAVNHFRMVESGEWYRTKKSEKCPRLYHNFAATPKKTQPFLSAKDGSKLIAVDVRSCQPTLLGWAIDQFLASNSKIQDVGMKNIEFNIIDRQVTSMCPENGGLWHSYSVRDALKRENEQWKSLCSNSTFYQTLAGNLDASPAELAKVKKGWMIWAFGEPYANYQFYNAVSVFTKENFPYIDQLVKDIKEENGYQEVARILQSAEVYLIFELVISYIRERVKTIISTKHDCIILPETYLDLALEAFGYAFRTMGIQGGVSITELSAANRGGQSRNYVPQF